jgi:hypothetical protein
MNFTLDVPGVVAGAVVVVPIAALPEPPRVMARVGEELQAASMVRNTAQTRACCCRREHQSNAWAFFLAITEIDH